MYATKYLCICKMKANISQVEHLQRSIEVNEQFAEVLSVDCKWEMRMSKATRVKRMYEHEDVFMPH